MDRKFQRGFSPDRCHSVKSRGDLGHSLTLDPPLGNIVVAGMETHVCVYQTVRSLLAREHTVHVASDAVVSRHPENRVVGLELARHAGAIVTSTEAVLFDLLKGSDAPEFKAISKLVR